MSCYSEICSFPPTRPWPCPWRLWASHDLRKTLLGPVFCELRSALPPRLRVSEPSICFCWALEMPSAGPNAIKQGKNRFSGPFLEGGLPEALRGLRQHCDDAWGGHFRRGGLARAFWHHLGFQNPEYASPELQKCFSGLPKARICFPWAVEMPLARQNTEKQGKKRDLF